MTATAPFMGARVVVLGASGFIGRWVARALTGEGASLWCGVRDASSARMLAGYGVHGTVSAFDATTDELEHFLRDVRPHLVFNLIGYGVDQDERDTDLSRAINEDVVKSLVKLVPLYRDHAWPGLSLVHAGSALEYGATDGDLNEEVLANPTTEYGRTKLAGTDSIFHAYRDHGLRAMVARLFTVYGPGEHQGRLLPSLLEAARGTGRIALSAGTQRRDFTYVEDVANGLKQLSLVNAPASAVVNLATGRLTTVREFVERAARVLAIEPSRLGFGDLPQRPEEMEHSDVTVKLLRAAISWVPATTIEDGVRATVSFLAEHGP